MVEKYGFVYIWYDRKRKMYYIGSHWGTEDDGYICSSNRMRDAYRRRTEDFKRRILMRLDSREKTFDKEYEWLQLAEKHKERYYNMHFNVGHWSQYPESCKTIGEKISYKNKGRSSTKKGKSYEELYGDKAEEVKKKIGKKSLGRVREYKPRTEEQIQKMSETTKGLWEQEEYREKMCIERKSRRDNPEYKEKQSIAHKGQHNSPKTEFKPGHAPHLGKKWYNNGLDRNLFIPGQEPTGWKLGYEINVC